MSDSVEYVELNMSNYDDDDVAQLNEWGIWAMGRIAELEAAVNAAWRYLDHQKRVSVSQCNSASMDVRKALQREAYDVCGKAVGDE